MQRFYCQNPVFENSFNRSVRTFGFPQLNFRPDFELHIACRVFPVINRVQENAFVAFNAAMEPPSQRA